MWLYPLNKDPLADFLPAWVLAETVTRIEVPAKFCESCCARFEGPSAFIKIGSNPGPRLIILHPDYYKKGTATGEALRAHELFHVWQREVIPNFNQAFTKEAIRVEAAGLQPRDNGFERPAYQFEQMVKEALLAEGYPEAVRSPIRGAA